MSGVNDTESSYSNLREHTNGNGCGTTVENIHHMFTLHSRRQLQMLRKASKHSYTFEDPGLHGKESVKLCQYLGYYAFRMK